MNSWLNSICVVVRDDFLFNINNDTANLHSFLNKNHETLNYRKRCLMTISSTKDELEFDLI